MTTWPIVVPEILGYTTIKFGHLDDIHWMYDTCALYYIQFNDFVLQVI